MLYEQAARQTSGGKNERRVDCKGTTERIQRERRTERTQREGRTGDGQREERTQREGRTGDGKREERETGCWLRLYGTTERTQRRAEVGTGEWGLADRELREEERAAWQTGRGKNGRSVQPLASHGSAGRQREVLHSALRGQDLPGWRGDLLSSTGVRTLHGQSGTMLYEQAARQTSRGKNERRVDCRGTTERTQRERRAERTQREGRTGDGLLAAALRDDRENSEKG